MLRLPLLLVLIFLVGTAHCPPNSRGSDQETNLPTLFSPVTIGSIPGLDPQVVTYAEQGYQRLLENGDLEKPEFLTICDMSQSANKQRFYLVDMQTGEVVHRSLVAHGKGSGEEYARRFSNRTGSHQTSLGFYVTAETYHGQHGLSLRLDGMEASNSRARDRAIVIHSAKYVSQEFIRTYGRLGRSFGCPSLPVKDYDEVIEKIAGGTCLFVYYPESGYLKSSRLLKQ